MTWTSQAEADAGGRARLRLPFATGANGALEALGPYRITGGDEAALLHVDELQVLEGRVLDLRLP